MTEMFVLMIAAELRRDVFILIIIPHVWMESFVPWASGARTESAGGSRAIAVMESIVQRIHAMNG